jgi:hypothetical protein
VSQTNLPEVRPAPVLEVLPAGPPSLPPLIPDIQRRRPAFVGRLFGLVRAALGWTWRWLVGAVMCFNFFILSWFTAVVAVGWTNRLVQAVVLRSWWRRSEVRHRMTFAEFCDSLGPDAPSPRPRWVWQERPLAHLNQPASTAVPSQGPLLYQLACWLRVWLQVTFNVPLQRGHRPGPITKALRVICWPWHSLWLNFKQGLLASLCTLTLLGLPCLFMCWSWEQGWINSFNGGYEEAFRGLGLGLVGIFLFAAMMVYVPMAQTHQAVTGRARSFFEFRFIWQLIRARLTVYVLLALAIGFWSLVLTLARDVVASENFAGNSAATAEEGLAAFRLYLFVVSLFMFPVYVLLRVFAALVYQSAVLKVLRRGMVTYRELHPTLAGWHQALNLKVVPRAETVGLGWAARLVVSVTYRRTLLTGLYLLWILFLVRFYVGYFFVYDPYIGILNHPLIEIPCFDFIPQHLYERRDF